MERSILLYDKCMPFGFAFWICLALALRQMEAKPVKMRLHFFHSASWRTKKWTIHLLTLFLLFFHVVFSCCCNLWSVFIIHWFTLKSTLVLVFTFHWSKWNCAGVGRAPALHGLWRFHCPHLRRQYMFNDSLYLFSFDILRLINPVLCLKFT